MVLCMSLELALEVALVVALVVDALEREELSSRA